MDVPKKSEWRFPSMVIRLHVHFNGFFGLHMLRVAPELLCESNRHSAQQGGTSSGHPLGVSERSNRWSTRKHKRLLESSRRPITSRRKPTCPPIPAGAPFWGKRAPRSPWLRAL